MPGDSYSELSSSASNGAARNDDELRVAEANHVSWSNDANWKGPCGEGRMGFLYFGMDDTRLCVSKRCVRLHAPFLWVDRCQAHCGWTINLSHQYGCAALIALIVVLLVGEGISWSVTLFKQKL